MKINIKCLLGKHDLPNNAITNLYGAIYRGGYCPRCDRLIQGKFLYNSWGEQIDKGHCILLSGTNRQLLEDLESGKYIMVDYA